MELTIFDVIAVVDRPVQRNKLLKYSVVISVNDNIGMSTKHHGLQLDLLI